MNNVLEYILDVKDRFSKTMGEAAAAASRFNEHAKAAEQHVTSLNSAMGNIKSMAGALGIAFSAYDAFTFVNEGISKAIAEEKFETGYQTLLKSKEAAAGLVEELKKSNEAVAFGNEKTLTAGQTLLTAGVHAEKLKVIMAQLGEVAQGSNRDVTELAEAYSVAAQRGYVEARRILQIPGALNEFSSMTGLKGKELAKFMAEGQIGIGQLDEMLHRLTSSGGEYFDAMKNYFASDAGRIAKQTHDIEMQQEEIGKKLIPAKLAWLSIESRMVGMLSSVAGWFQRHKELIKGMGSAIMNFISDNKDLIIDIGLVVGAFYAAEKAAMAFRTAQLLLNSAMLTDPFYLAAAAVAALLLEYKNVIDEQNAAQDKLKDAAEKGGSEELKHIKELIAAYKEKNKVTDEAAKSAVMEKELALKLSMYKKALAGSGLGPESDRLIIRNSYLAYQMAQSVVRGNVKLDDGTPTGTGKPTATPDATIDGISGGGVRNMTINVSKFFDTITFQSAGVVNDAKTTADTVVKELLRILNSANKIQYGQQ